MYEIKKNYQNNETLRNSFNKLAESTFGLNFESWYKNGLWRENYIPYSIIENDTVVSNVSVNITDMCFDSKKYNLIQLGTVMTDKSHRNKGLIRILINEIEKDFANKVDGFYLFANDEVVNFYPKFGYTKSDEFQYSKTVSLIKNSSLKKLSVNTKQDFNHIEDIINNSRCFGKFEMINNSGLIMFYLTSFMQESVYYSQKLDACIIADIDGEDLLIHNVFSKNTLSENDIIFEFGKEIKNVTFGFTPNNTYGMTCQKIFEEDTTFFVKGKFFENYEDKKLMFPTLSHA